MFALLLLGCDEPAPAPAASSCTPDRPAAARVMTAADTIPGETAVGSPGDLLLENGRARFVITEPDKGSTYYHYGGIVADAVAMDGCTMDGEDKLDEVGIIVGTFDLADYTSSVLRAFRGETAEVLADGSDGGPAVVRVTGVDDTYWLVEYELIAAAANDGGRPLSEPLGISLQVDYVLEPDSAVLGIEVTATNVGTVDRELVVASLLSLGATMDLHSYASESTSVGGFSLDYGIPWLVATDGEDALAFGVEDGNLAYLGISGMDVAIDITQGLGEPIDVAPGESDTRTMLLAAGAGSGVSATGPLAAANPNALPNQPFTLGEASGRVVDPAGTPVAGATILLQARSPRGEWGTLDEALTGPDGGFRVRLLDFAEPWSWQVVAQAEGRHDSAAVPVASGAVDLVVPISAAGAVTYEIVDDLGEESAARIKLESSSGSIDLWLTGTGSAPVPPDSYRFTATRGYEYAPVTGTIEVPDGGAAPLSLVLQKVVDTSGYVSIDTHVHSWDSTDSRTPPADVLLHAAAHGLDLVVHTEHENIVDRSALPTELGLDPQVSSIIGEEVTATIPEHLTMFPAEPDGSVRGGIVEWYGHDLDELFGMMRERSEEGVNLLNHPTWLDRIGWDRLLAEPTLDDPTLYGLSPDAALWSWNLDGMEVMNGHTSPFDSGNRRWGNWQSMLNAGRRVVAVGCSDDHSGDQVGFPRSYVPTSTDAPSDVPIDEVVSAFRGGAVMSSSGAFARVSLADGTGMGQIATDTDGEASLFVEIQAIPQIDVTFVSVFVNCDEVLTVPTSDPTGVVKIGETLAVPLPLEEDAHITIAAFGEQWLPAGLPQFDPTQVPRVLTSAIFVDTDGDGSFSAPGGRVCDVRLSPP